jgi:hypothetical protein
MRQSRWWSPADLNRQRLLVYRSALRADVDRTQLSAARERWLAQVRSVLGGAVGLSACFLAGVAVGGRELPHDKANAQSRQRRWSSFAAGIFKTLVLRALMCELRTKPEVTPASSTTTHPEPT